MEAIGPRKMLLSAKDASRKQTVRELQNALTQYQIEEGTLPNAQSIIMADDGAKPICKQGVTTDVTCVNLDALIPEYIAALPQDTSETNANYTGYKVYREPLGGRPQVTSPHFNDRSEGLVGYWPFHEGQGTTAVDGSGQGNNGTLVGSPAWTTGKRGQTILFDGVDDYISVGNPVSLRITGSQTICMWLYPTNLTARRNPYAKAYGGEGTITQETNGTLSYYYGTNGGNGSPYQGFVTNTAVVSVNTWTHVCLVRDLSAMKLFWYINGAMNRQANASYPAALAGALNVTIGSGYAGYYHGLIDEFFLLNRALTQEEIRLVMNHQF
ncbi:MAG: LamG domain-containing protein, partial [Candidatus Peribacteraceae bacterium]